MNGKIMRERLLPSISPCLRDNNDDDEIKPWGVALRSTSLD